MHQAIATVEGIVANLLCQCPETFGQMCREEILLEKRRVGDVCSRVTFVAYGNFGINIDISISSFAADDLASVFLFRQDAVLYVV